MQPSTRHAARYAALAIVTVLLASPAVGSSREFGVLLSPADYVYLAAQVVERHSSVLQNMSPIELHRLHRMINDQRTQSEPQLRTKAVMEALAEFESNQQWEVANPGRRWKDRNQPAVSRAAP